MKAWQSSIEIFSRWIDSVAGTIISLFDRLGSQQHVQVVERDRDVFTMRSLDNGKNSDLADQQISITNGSIVDTLPADWAANLQGSRVELVLQPSRFLFRPLDLPKRAVEYIDGIVRSQIDRLTPWSMNEAIYGWTPPDDTKNDRISLTIAATPRRMVAPYLQTLAGLGVASVAVSTFSTDLDSKATPIRILDQRMRTRLDIGRVRSILIAVFLLSGISAGVSIGAAAMMTSSLDAQQRDLLQKISARRIALRSGANLAVGSAEQMLERRKQMTPSSVIALEGLSTLLPDDTYVTELHIDGEKLQIVGLTRDAPALIRLIEQSPHFAHAVFFAPTTRSPEEMRERFHIEAIVKPVFAAST
jgi:general secretion pathway protein L